MRIVDEDSSLFIDCDAVSDDDKHAYKALLDLASTDSGMKIVRCEYGTSTHTRCSYCIGRKYRNKCPYCGTHIGMDAADPYIYIRGIIIKIKRCFQCYSTIYTCGNSDIIAFSPSLFMQGGNDDTI